MHDRQEIQSLKHKFREQLANQLVTAVVILDADLTIKYVNHAAEALFVKSLYKLYGEFIEDVLITSSMDKKRFKEILTSGQEFTDSDVYIKLADGNNITVELTTSASEFDNAPYIILEIKQIDKQKQISVEAYQQQQWEAARDLIRGLAHEIKNPLGGLRGAAQLLSKELTEDQKEYTAMIIEQSDRLTNLVDKLLGPNQLPVMLEQNIHSVLETIIKLVSFDNPKQIKLCRDYDPSIPEIKFDEEKIQQAILNIVNNAFQILDNNGSIKLKTRVASNQIINSQRVRLCIQISIVDDGPGIPKKIQDTLFYPMVSGRTNGTGLGLSISQTIIHQHHGKLTCTSKPGKTEFIILLPIPEEK